MQLVVFVKAATILCDSIYMKFDATVRYIFSEIIAIYT